MDGYLESIVNNCISPKNEIKFNTMNEDMNPTVNFKPSASFGEEKLPRLSSQGARENCSHVPMLKYGNTFFYQIRPCLQPSLRASTHHPWLQQPESAIARPNFHNPISHPISANSSYNFPRDQNLPVQPPFSAATDLPLLPQREGIIISPIPQNPTSFTTATNSFGSSSGWFHCKNITFQGSFDRSQLSYQASDGIYKQQISYGKMQSTDLPLLPQREFHPIPQNPTSFPTATNSFGSSSGWFHDKNTTFQGSFDRSQVSYRASDGIYKQQIAYVNMQAYGIDCQLSRRNQRINMRRESRSKERLPCQIPEKKRVSKCKTKKYNSILQACLLLTNSEEETKTQSSLGEMKLLVLKQLQNSDVGTLGRVVLPKRVAEAELPPLQMKEGINIPAKDFDTNCQWIFKFRFWPNNKSRMYLLENTGGFIQRHGLKKGDYLMLYGAEGRYMVRGMKATEPEQSNSSACTSEAKLLQSSEDGGGKIVSQVIGNGNMDEIKEEEEKKMKMKMVDDEPQLPLETSCTHSEANNFLVSKGEENNTLSMTGENTPEISESILVSQGMENFIDMISDENILAKREEDKFYENGLDFASALPFDHDYNPISEEDNFNSEWLLEDLENLTFTHC